MNDRLQPTAAFASTSLQRDGACVVAGHVAILLTMAYFAALLGGGGFAIVSVIERFFP